MIEYRLTQEEDIAGVIKLCAAEPWPSYVEDTDRTWQVLTAAGVTTVVAVDTGHVVGFIQMQSDGQIQAHISLILVAADRRRQGIGAELVMEAFKRSGAKRVDLITADAHEFYRSFACKEWAGFRIHPQFNKDGTPNQRIQRAVSR